jgi:signal transduction histidine kinase
MGKLSSGPSRFTFDEVTRRNLLTSGVGMALVVIIAARGIVQYPEVAWKLGMLCGLFLVTLFLERPAARRPLTLGSLILLSQIILTAGCFYTAPVADYWAVLLLPSIIFAIRYNSHSIGITWVAVQTLFMVVTLIITEGWPDAVEFFLTYVVAYILVASYPLMLKKTEASESETRVLLNKLADANIMLRDNAGRIEELAAVNERHRLARELHDSVTQTLFSLTLIARSASILNDKDPAQVPGKLQELQELSQAALSEMRDLIAQLRPVDGEGFYDSLRRHVEDRKRRDGLDVELILTAADLDSRDVRVADLYRIVQEALNNVMKHSQVATATVEFRNDGDGIVLIIRDKGVGFNPEDVTYDDPGRHIGLRSIHERCVSLGVELNIHSVPGEGTDLTIRIPLLPGEEHHG